MLGDVIKGETLSLITAGELLANHPGITFFRKLSCRLFNKLDII